MFKLEMYLELHNWALKIHCYNDKFRFPTLMFYKVLPSVVKKDIGSLSLLVTFPKFLPILLN